MSFDNLSTTINTGIIVDFATLEYEDTFYKPPEKAFAFDKFCFDGTKSTFISENVEIDDVIVKGFSITDPIEKRTIENLQHMNGHSSLRNSDGKKIFENRTSTVTLVVKGVSKAAALNKINTILNITGSRNINQQQEKLAFRVRGGDGIPIHKGFFSCVAVDSKVLQHTACIFEVSLMFDTYPLCKVDFVSNVQGNDAWNFLEFNYPRYFSSKRAEPVVVKKTSYNDEKKLDIDLTSIDTINIHVETAGIVNVNVFGKQLTFDTKEKNASVDLSDISRSNNFITYSGVGEITFSTFETEVLVYL